MSDSSWSASSGENVGLARASSSSSSSSTSGIDGRRRKRKRRGGEDEEGPSPAPAGSRSDARMGKSETPVRLLNSSSSSRGGSGDESNGRSGSGGGGSGESGSSARRDTSERRRRTMRKSAGETPEVRRMKKGPQPPLSSRSGSGSEGSAVTEEESPVEERPLQGSGIGSGSDDGGGSGGHRRQGRRRAPNGGEDEGGRGVSEDNLELRLEGASSSSAPPGPPHARAQHSSPRHIRRRHDGEEQELRDEQQQRQPRSHHAESSSGDLSDLALSASDSGSMSLSLSMSGSGSGSGSGRGSSKSGSASGTKASTSSAAHTPPSPFSGKKRERVKGKGASQPVRVVAGVRPSQAPPPYESHLAATRSKPPTVGFPSSTGHSRGSSSTGMEKKVRGSGSGAEAKLLGASSSSSSSDGGNGEGDGASSGGNGAGATNGGGGGGDGDDDDEAALVAREPSWPPFECPICGMSDGGIEESSCLLSCGHRFCTACVEGYFRAGITSKTFPLRCLEGSCRVEVSVGDIAKAVDAALLALFYEFTLQTVVEGGGDQFFSCLTPGCEYIAFYGPTDRPQMRCPMCKKTYCVKCKVPWHSKQTCSTFQASRALTKEEIDLAKALTNGKQCPKCGVWVELSGGCNHIVCRCKHKFCFHCGNSFPCNCGKDPHVAAEKERKALKMTKAEYRVFRDARRARRQALASLTEEKEKADYIASHPLPTDDPKVKKAVKKAMNAPNSLKKTPSKKGSKLTSKGEKKKLKETPSKKKGSKKKKAAPIDEFGRIVLAGFWRQAQVPHPSGKAKEAKGGKKKAETGKKGSKTNPSKKKAASTDQKTPSKKGPNNPTSFKDPPTPSSIAQPSVSDGTNVAVTESETSKVKDKEKSKEKGKDKGTKKGKKEKNKDKEKNKESGEKDKEKKKSKDKEKAKKNKNKNKDKEKDKEKEKIVSDNLPKSETE